MTELKLRRGRPAPGTQDAAVETCCDFLDSLGVEYDRVEHEALYTMEALEPVVAALGGYVAKNLFLTNRQQTEFYLLIMPADKPFKTKYLSAQLGCSRLSFGSEAQLLEHLGTSHGSASILGFLNDRENRVRLLADEDLKLYDHFACHPCRNTCTLRFALSDILNTVLPALGHAPTWVTLPREPE